MYSLNFRVYTKYQLSIKMGLTLNSDDIGSHQDTTLLESITAQILSPNENAISYKSTVICNIIFLLNLNVRCLKAEVSSSRLLINLMAFNR